MKKNNDEILYNSISDIDENIIASSLVFKPKSKKIIIWASLAACLCAVSVTYAVIYKNNFNNKKFFFYSCVMKVVTLTLNNVI